MKPAILIVDDSLTVRMDLDEAFQAAGLKTVLCATAAAAREALARGPFDLIVLDVLLPDADGIDLLKELRTAPATAKTPVMLLSTEAEVRDRIRGLTTGGDEYIGKPYDRAYVVARTRELLRRRQPVSPVGAATTVLIIDDSATSRGDLREALESAGYTVVTAASGEEGLRAAVDVRPGAVVVDGVLPGIDGATVIRTLRGDAALRRTPCLLLTASEDQRDELRALDAGADAFVRKDEGTGVTLARLAAILRSASAPAGLQAASSLLGPKKILAVDDSQTFLHQLASELQQEGFDLVLARSGAEALELLAVQAVDCILLDLVMPGLSGHETCQRIKSSPAWREIPLIILTALDEREAMIRGINAGADDYITKSGDFAVLKARLRAQLRRKQFEDENSHIREQLLRKELEATEARAARELAETRAALLAELQGKNDRLELSVQSERQAHEALKKAQSQLVQTEKLAGLGQMVAGVAHEINNPLAFVINNMAVLQRDFGALRGLLQLYAAAEPALAGADPGALERIRALCERIELGYTIAHFDEVLLRSRDGLDRIRKIVLDLRDFARLDDGERQEADLNAGIASTIHIVRWRADSRQVELELDLGPLPAVSCYPAKINQVVMNLVINAIDACRQGDRVTIRTRLQEGQVRIEVIDTGHGIAPEILGQIFDPFFTTKPPGEGTGLGLSISYGIVQAHGGMIEVESVPDRGARFAVCLPIPAPAAE